MKSYLLLLFGISVLMRGSLGKPNIIFILTDDQDFVLGGMAPLNKTKTLIANSGLTFLNAFANTPICCPSRASILTGRYQHNHHVVNNSLSGNCSSPAWQEGLEKQTFIGYFKQINYTTFYAGKYLNAYGSKNAGGVEHVPPGWDHWFGLVGNSKYYDYNLSINGKIEEHGSAVSDYYTDVINNQAINFLKKYKVSSGPFFMMVAPPAPHEPFTPAPPYSQYFQDKVAPKTQNYNITNPTKHWLLRQAKPLTDNLTQYIDEAFRNRWRTLLSVDDLVENIVKQLESQNLLQNTYIFFSSDHGYHLGQFSLPIDKRQLYETDIRIPLIVRGPGIAANQVSQAVVTTIDLAPTFMELSGLKPPISMDGKSFVPVLQKPQRHWQTSFLVEYKGEGSLGPIPDCPQYKDDGIANCHPACICEDSVNNTYVCVRTITDNQNLIYCHFHDNEEFIEMYNINLDPYQINNLAFYTREKRKDEDFQQIIKNSAHLKELLNHLRKCKGNDCIIMKS